MIKEDVNTEETSETSEEDTSASETETEEKKPVPYERVSKIVEEKNKYRDEAEDLKEQLKDKETTSDDKKDDKEDISDTVEKVIEKREAKKTAEKESEDRTFKREVDDILELHSEVKRDDFLKFVEDNGEKYGLDSVKGAFQVYQDLGKVESTEDKKKAGLPESEGDTTVKIKPLSEADDKKTFDQLVEDTIEEEGLK